jgi:RHS repeat-associated protein
LFFSANSAGQLLTESFPNSGVIITNSYDSLLRRSALSGATVSVAYSYDAASRLSSVSEGTNSASYYYLANASLVSNIIFQTGGVTRMTTTKSYDNLNRLTSIQTGAPGQLVDGHWYAYNSANQRTRVALADGSYWVYQYDSLGQVVSGNKYWADGSEVQGQQFDYTFDTIGNRKTATVNGNTGTYTANSLNQYSQRTVPGAVDVLGTAHSNATVTINNQGVSRHGEYFFKEFSVANSSSAVYTQLVTVAALKNGGTGNTNQPDIVSMATGSAFVAESPEGFGYDSDGNLNNDGRWAYTWDGENRLVAMQTLTNLPANVPQQQLLFSYDYMGRRISKVVSNYNGSWSVVSNLRFVYDAWNLIAELDATNGLVRSYTWGLDLSGSGRDAGGVGGLLSVNAGTNGTHYAAYDGNGNVTVLVDASSGVVSAQYEYSPAGETLRATGPMAKANPFRWSTRYTDDETSLVMYPRRPYSPSTGRWLSRDPLAEDGSDNLYASVANDPVDQVDPFGLYGNPVSGPGGPVGPGSPVYPNPGDPYGYFTGFHVIGSVIQEWYGRVLQAVGIDHVDIAYNGTVVYVGRGGAVGRWGNRYTVDNRNYPLSVRTTGNMRYGQRAPCPCRGATDADILDCLSKRRIIAGRNCQGDVQDAVGDCCLSGFRTLVGSLFPSTSGH